MGLLSFLKPTILFQKHSDFNGDVRVQKLINGEINLYADGIVQSTLSGKNVKNGYWQKSFGLISEMARKAGNPETALVLGLGGGTIQKLLSEKFDLKAIHSVEIDSIMTEAAEKFFGASDIKNHKIISGDVSSVLADPNAYGLSEKYDLVVSDVFIGSGFKNRFDTHGLSNYAKLIKNKASKYVFFNSVFMKEDKQGIILAENEIKSVFPNLKHVVYKYPVVSDNHLFYSLVS